MRASATLLLIVALSISACGHKQQEGPAPTHNSSALQPIRPNQKHVEEMGKSDLAMKAGVAFARSKYGDKLDYDEAALVQKKINTLAPGVDPSVERKREADPNYQMWELTIILANVPKSEPHVDPTVPDPFPISERVFLITNSMKVTEGTPLKIPSFALQHKR